MSGTSSQFGKSIEIPEQLRSIVPEGSSAFSDGDRLHIQFGSAGQQASPDVNAIFRQAARIHGGNARILVRDGEATLSLIEKALQKKNNVHKALS